MKKIPIIFFFTLALSWVGCSNEKYDPFQLQVIGKDTLYVSAHKEYYFFPCSGGVRSSVKGYPITNNKEICDTVQSIDGFDDIYNEGTEYKILVNILSPKYDVLDWCQSKFQLIKVLKETKVD